MRCKLKLNQLEEVEKMLGNLPSEGLPRSLLLNPIVCVRRAPCNCFCVCSHSRDALLPRHGCVVQVSPASVCSTWKLV